MFDWGAFTLFLFIAMRMAGFVRFSPIFGRSGIPTMFQAGLILLLSWTVYAVYGGSLPPPATALGLGIKLVLELGLGFLLGMVTRFFFYIPDQAGELIDAQMGMSMARTYDPTSQSQATPTANLLNILAILLFFAADGHITLLRLMLTSGEIVPFGATMLGRQAAEQALLLFAECVLLAVKLSLPILGAELLGQVGMGVLMKAIPQINIFAINIELKVIIGLVLLMFLIAPMSEYLLEAESMMLSELGNILSLAAAP